MSLLCKWNVRGICRSCNSNPLLQNMTRIIDSFVTWTDDLWLKDWQIWREFITSKQIRTVYEQNYIKVERGCRCELLEMFWWYSNTHNPVFQCFSVIQKSSRWTQPLLKAPKLLLPSSSRRIRGSSRARLPNLDRRGEAQSTHKGPKHLQHRDPETFRPVVLPTMTHL